ncbi:sodium-coupled monocarboxylate transporter 2-like [Panulirus ornatus]|uniref:sodium-coupled monocarboxylate transporter 2-like n=1 Tax=Panulirus ornatus TaxID=150431 RepID=UPI003A85A32E
MTVLLVWEDFLKDRDNFKRMSDEKSTNVMKLISLVVGAIGICVALLVGNLGSIFHVNSSIGMALLGPQMGVFLTGICTPWVTYKGAVAGLAVSSVFNLWLVIGKFVRGGGSLPTLPLSTDGCPENLGHLANYSEAAFFKNITVTDALLSNDTSVHESDFKTMYDISYCYNAAIGLTVTLVISNLFSLCTGLLSPGDLEVGLTSPTCARFHQWLWGLFPSSRSVTISSSSRSGNEDNTAAFTMSPETDTDDGNTRYGCNTIYEDDGGDKDKTISMHRTIDTNTATQGNGTHQQMVFNTSPKMNTGDLKTNAI